MLSQTDADALETGADIILKSPGAISRSIYVATYNIVYAHCSVPAETYFIEGECIYGLLKRKINEYTAGIPFTASIRDAAAQAVHFRNACSLLEKVFGYLERFYIRTSLYKRNGVVPLAELFYTHLHFNYITKIEDDLLGLIFLELETIRGALAQECAGLCTVVGFYTEVLRMTGHEDKLARFRRMYLENYAGCTDFTMGMGKLLKRVYIEMYYSTAVMGDKGLCKEIVGHISGRADEAIRYIEERIRTGSSFKHAFKVVMAMGEDARERLRCSMEKMMLASFKATASFADIHGCYARFRRLIHENKMAGYGDLLRKLTRGQFSNLNISQRKMAVTEFMSKFDDIIKNTEKLANEVENIMPVLLDEGESQNSAVNDNGDLDGMAMQTGLSLLIELFILVHSEELMRAYVTRAQRRLLSGRSPSLEKYIYERLAQSSCVEYISILNNSIATYTGALQAECTLGHSTGKVRLLKHTASFWNITKQDSEIHPELAQIRDKMLARERLGLHECIAFNYSLSPVTFSWHSTTYRMGTDLFSLFYTVHKMGEDGIERSALHRYAPCGEINQLLSRLIDTGLCVENAGTIKQAHPQTTPSADVVDLFLLANLPAEDNGHSVSPAHCPALIDSTICTVMKRKKEMALVDLIQITEEATKGSEVAHLNILEAISRLIEKGYLERVEDTIKYVP